MNKNKKWWWKYRRLNHLYAVLGAYFWHPCPLCGEYFGGHEWLYGNSLMTSPNTGKCVCPNCGEKAKKANMENFPSLYYLYFG